MLAVSSLTILANATIAPALPGLAAAFADTPGIEGLSGLALSLPSLSIVLSAGLFGWLADRFDPLRILLTAMILYALAGVSGAFAPTIASLLAGRFALGFGVAGTMTVATLMVSTLWTGRAPFFIYLAALPIALLAWLTLRGQSRLRDRSARRTGSVSIPYPWLVSAGIGYLTGCSMVVFYIIPTRLPFHLVSIGLEGATTAGMAIAAVTLGGIPGSSWFGRIRSRFNEWNITAGCFALISIGFVFIARAQTLPEIIAGTLLAGLGLGPAMPNLLSWLMALVPDQARGRASGLFTVALFGGQFLSPLIASAVSEQVGLRTTFTLFAAALLTTAAALFTCGRILR